MVECKKIILDILENTLKTKTRIVGIEKAAELIITALLNGLTPKLHGLSKHPLYRIWQLMKRRCYDSNVPEYKYYGGRGVIICEGWKYNFISFFDWSIKNGWGNKLQIDRIDNNGIYEPNNCRWVTHREQQRNKKNNLVIVINQERKTLAEWAEISGVSRGVIKGRFDSGIKGKSLLNLVVKNAPRMPMHPILRKKKIDEEWVVYDDKKEYPLKNQRGRVYVHYKDTQVNINSILGE